MLEQKFLEEEFQNCFLVEINCEESKKRIEIFVDADGGMTIGKCAKLNRFLQNFLDEDEKLGPKYVLDVSSPGVGKPLKLHRQYVNNVGRMLKIVRVNKQKPIKGKLMEVTEEDFLLRIEKQIGNKKKKEVSEERFLFENIKTATIEVSF